MSVRKVHGVSNKMDNGRKKFSKKVVRRSVRRANKAAAHDCWDNAVPYESNGALGHGWECGICGKFLQAG